MSKIHRGRELATNAWEHTFISGVLMRKGGLRTVPSIMLFPATVIALHTCYILVSLALSLLLLGSTLPRSGVLKGVQTLLILFGTKGPFTLRLTSLDK